MARKDALLRLHKSLIAKRDAMRRQLADDLNLTSSSQDCGDEVDAAQDGTQTQIHSQLAALESRELNQIEQAISMIREGRYGQCESCDARIPVARLNALPFTTVCIDCQRKLEVMGRNGVHATEDWESAYEYEGRTSDREYNLGDIDVEAT